MTILDHCNVAMRQDFILIMSESGKGNGDPSKNAEHRTDEQTGHGIWSDVMMKRAWRDGMDIMHGTEKGREIYIQSKGIALNELHAEAYKAKEITSTGTKQNRDEIAVVRQWMCEKYIDVRTLGAVMTTGKNCGQVRGPLQLTFARSVEPIEPIKIALTRQAVTKREDLERKDNDMGEKSWNPFALYVAHGYFTPHFAKSTGFSSDDFALFWEVFQNCWQFTRSAGRGVLELRFAGVFSHKDPFGNAPSYKLFKRITIKKREGIAFAREFEDYQIEINTANLPNGVTFSSLVDLLE